MFMAQHSGQTVQDIQYADDFVKILLLINCAILCNGNCCTSPCMTTAM